MKVMKKVLLISGIIFVILSNANSQSDTIPKSTPLYWTIEFGSSYLTNIDIVKNKPFAHLLALSGSWYFYYDIPIGMKKTDKLNYGFILAPGLGFAFNTFGIDKQLVENQGRTEFVNFSTHYNYSIIQEIFVDLPIDFRYLTKPDSKNRNFGFELGAKLGFLIFAQKEFAIKNGNDLVRTTTYHLNNLNNLRYGLSGKVSHRNLKISKISKEYIGFAYSLIANYYPSKLFENDKGPDTQYWSAGLGLSFIFK